MTEKRKDPNARQGKQSPPRPPLAGMRPGGPNNPDPGYTPGPDAGGDIPGGESAAEVTGSGIGGDIDLPDVSGRGSLEDIARHNEEEQGS